MDEGLGAADHRAYRSAQSLAQTERDRVGFADKIAHVDLLGNGGVEDAGAVDVDLEATPMRKFHHRAVYFGVR